MFTYKDCIFPFKKHLEGAGLVHARFQKRPAARAGTVVLVAMFAALTAVGGWIKIPIPPVPITLQTLFVYLAGDLLGWKRAAASQILFVILGLMGVPIFAGGGGPAYVLKPTFGYLIGFILAAGSIGYLARRLKRSGPWTDLLLPNITGLLIIFFPGVLYLAFSMRFIVGQPLTFQQAMISGILIFLPSELGKAVFAAWISQKIKSRLPDG